MQVLCVYIFIFCDGPVPGHGVKGRRKKEKSERRKGERRKSRGREEGGRNKEGKKEGGRKGVKKIVRNHFYLILLLNFFQFC